MHERLKIAYSSHALHMFGAIGKRDIVDVFSTDFTDVSAVVITDKDTKAL